MEHPPHRITIRAALQIPIEQWRAYPRDPTIADATLDRLIHNSYRLTFKGESMRKQKTTAAARTARGR